MSSSRIVAPASHAGVLAHLTLRVHAFAAAPPACDVNMHEHSHADTGVACARVRGTGSRSFCATGAARRRDHSSTAARPRVWRGCSKANASGFVQSSPRTNGARGPLARRAHPQVATRQSAPPAQSRRRRGGQERTAGRRERTSQDVPPRDANAPDVGDVTVHGCESVRQLAHGKRRAQRARARSAPTLRPDAANLRPCRASETDVYYMLCKPASSSQLGEQLRTRTAAVCAREGGAAAVNASYVAVTGCLWSDRDWARVGERRDWAWMVAGAADCGSESPCDSD
jgi:hypothetical protein